MGDIAIGFEAPALGFDLGGAEPDGDPEVLGTETGETETPTSGAAAEAGGDPEAGKDFHAVENGKLSAAAKATIEKLKVENPQLAKAVQRALFAEDRFRKELPGGFKEVAQLRDKIEQLGGDEGIQGIQAELSGWKDFDAQYTAGDPRVLEFLTETPEAKEAFLKIAPATFEKYREAHPEGYAAYVSQVFMADMQDGQIPLAVQLLGSLLGRATLGDSDKAEAKRLYDTLAGYVNRITELSRKQVAAPMSAKPTGADPRASELDSREQTLRRQEWTGEVDRQHGRIFSESWKRLAAAVPADKASLVRRLYSLHLQEKLAAKKDFTPNMDRYFKAKQKDGFMRLHESTFKESVPLALRSAMAEAGVNGRKAPAAATGVQASKPGQAPAKPVTGFTAVGKKPNFATDVDRNRTTPAMWQQKQAILKTGVRVTWQ